MSRPRTFYPTIGVLLVGGVVFLLTLGAAVRSCMQRSSSRGGEPEAPPPAQTPNPPPAISPPVAPQSPPRLAEVAPRLAKALAPPAQVSIDADPSADPSLTDDELKLLELRRDLASRNRQKLLQRRLDAGQP